MIFDNLADADLLIAVDIEIERELRNYYGIMSAVSWDVCAE